MNPTRARNKLEPNFKLDYHNNRLKMLKGIAKKGLVYIPVLIIETD